MKTRILAAATVLSLTSMPAMAGSMNGIALNALNVNALTENGLATNGWASNGLGSNGLGSNALTDNALTDNALTQNGGRAHLAGFTLEAIALPDGTIAGW